MDQAEQVDPSVQFQTSRYGKKKFCPSPPPVQAKLDDNHANNLLWPKDKTVTNHHKQPKMIVTAEHITLNKSCLFSLYLHEYILRLQLTNTIK